MSRSRRRRTPEQAREEILAAATDLIACYGPDGVGLRQVAERVGVTHGLVTHYFGTYAALVQAVLRRENERARARIRERMRADADIPYAEGLTRVLFDTLADQRYVRLWAWSKLHPEAPTAPAENLAALVDAMQAGIRTALPPGAATPERARLEAVVLLGLSAAYGYALGNDTWLSSLGHDPSGPGHEEAFRATLAQAIATHLSGGTPA
jgi:AcrR family transcriptional regulator